MQYLTNPTINFWIALAVTVNTGIVGGAVHLTNVVPDSWIPVVTSYAALFAFLGTSYLTAAHAVLMGQQK